MITEEQRRVPVELSGVLDKNDVMMRHPKAGALLWANGISVPPTLQEKLYYSATLLIEGPGDEFSFSTDVGVEPGQVNAVGQKIAQKLTFIVPSDIDPLRIIDKLIRIKVIGDGRHDSDVFATFRRQLGEV